MEASKIELVETGTKRDLRGRRIETEEEKVRLLAAFDRSGLTQRAFAEREGISYHSLVWWLHRRRREGTPKCRRPERPAMSFAQFEVAPRAPSAPPPHSPTLEVCLADGTIVRGGSAAELAALIKALRD